MSIKGILLAGAALCAISAAPAFAANAPHMHIAAMHQGGVVKSAMHTNGATNVTYTFSVSTAVSTKAGYNVKTPLAATYYTWQSSGSICMTPKKEKVSLSTKKTKYASIAAAVETESEGLLEADQVLRRHVRADDQEGLRQDRHFQLLAEGEVQERWQRI